MAAACGAGGGSSTGTTGAPPPPAQPGTHALITVAPGWHALDPVQHGIVPGQVAVGTGSGHCPVNRRTVELVVTPRPAGATPAPAPSAPPERITTEEVQAGGSTVTARVVSPPSVDCPSSVETLSVTDAGWVWDIEVSGDPAAAADHHQEVLAMLRSLRFEQGTPSPVPLPL